MHQESTLEGSGVDGPQTGLALAAGGTDHPLAWNRSDRGTQGDDSMTSFGKSKLFEDVNMM